MNFTKHFVNEFRMASQVPVNVREELQFKRIEVHKDLRTHIVIALLGNLFLFPVLIVYGMDKVAISLFLGMLVAFVYAKGRLFIHSFWMGLKDGLDGKDWSSSKGGIN